jgi:hypothetical protein
MYNTIRERNLMEHIHNNLIKIGGSLGNVPQKLKILVFGTVSPFLSVHIILY